MKKLPLQYKLILEAESKDITVNVPNSTKIPQDNPPGWDWRFLGRNAPRRPTVEPPGWRGWDEWPEGQENPPANWPRMPDGRPWPRTPPEGYSQYQGSWGGSYPPPPGSYIYQVIQEIPHDFWTQTQNGYTVTWEDLPENVKQYLMDKFHDLQMGGPNTLQTEELWFALSLFFDIVTGGIGPLGFAFWYLILPHLIEMYAQEQQQFPGLEPPAGWQHPTGAGVYFDTVHNKWIYYDINQLGLPTNWQQNFYPPVWNGQTWVLTPYENAPIHVVPLYFNPFTQQWVYNYQDSVFQWVLQQIQQQQQQQQELDHYFDNYPSGMIT